MICCWIFHISGADPSPFDVPMSTGLDPPVLMTRAKMMTPSVLGILVKRSGDFLMGFFRKKAHA